MPILRLSATARRDVERLLKRSAAQFGADARIRYEDLLHIALRDVATDPRRRGSLLRPELGPGILTYHLRHSAAAVTGGMVRRPRHLLLYRLGANEVVEVGRVLHDSMELERHLPRRFGDE